ncbi:MAG TPA: type II toxin-antitoxin system prevent-host-death family antitoxin [Chloroflexota bacterium]|nr:type II toxin-antitoxin system prevent-host-death family antitoxin [Chloroflexota bacterium]
MRFALAGHGMTAVSVAAPCSANWQCMPDPLGITHQHSVADTWTVTLAKARFREVIERARVRGPQLITRRGRPAAMLVGAGESAPRTHRAATLGRFFAGLTSAPCGRSGHQARCGRAR